MPRSRAPRTHRHVRTLLVAAIAGAAGLTVFGQARLPPPGPHTRADFEKKEPILAKTAEEQAKTFVLPPGYRMELVLSDPDINTPAVVEFDGNGRMYVAEFVTYMPDVEGTGQHEPRSRISRWEDTDGNGTYDRKTIFVDNLVLPRNVLTMDNNSILVNETASNDLVKWTDTNNDGTADRREVFYTGVGVGRDGNLEHEQSGFMWGLDNWIYSTYNSFRFRWTPTGVIRENTGANGGQWGLSMDDDGKPWFVCAGCEYGPLNFHVPIQYGAFSRLDGEYEADFLSPYPIVGLGDMQGGMGRVRMPIGHVNHMTATVGPDIVRSHRMPEDLYGDLLFTEPVGRLIRRARIVKNEGLTQLQNVYPKSEFILSSDPLFRPVNIKTGPDGLIYISDMYRGIIQEGQWTGPGSYLRHKIQQYQLEKVINHGRIWRLRFDGTPAFPGTPAGPAAVEIPGQPALAAIAPDFTKPRMLDETPAQLVAHLSHANGWWRDTAQRLLVLKQDKSVVPALQQLVRGSNLLARFHAMWTLEGLGALDAALVREQLKDPNPRMRIQAIRASETLFKQGDRSFADDYRAAAKDADVDVVLQAVLTLNFLRVEDAEAVLKATMASNPARGIQEIGKRVLSNAARGRGVPGLTPSQQNQYEAGSRSFAETCAACHGQDGLGVPMAGAEPGAMMAPPLGGSPRVQGHRDYVVKVLLHGLTGPLAGKTFTNVMVPMGTQTDEWIANIASYIRNDFGNTGAFVTPEDVARVRRSTARRSTMWTAPEIEAALPRVVEPQPTWKATASVNAERAAQALTTIGWSTAGAAELAGTWFQVELPQALNLAEIEFNTPGLGRGGPGRGGPAQAGPPQPRRYQVQLSMDGVKWTAPVAQGEIGTLVAAAFPAQRARFVRVTQTTPGTVAGPLQVTNVRLFAAP
ncbi:MAG: c-type cytochrome [Acidobacteria bacterium]|nr:c-type cytochrome [Acidobacteriota bacterium]